MKQPAQSVAEEVLVSITDALPQRVAPGCRHFGSCGGCQLQDIAYPDQLSAKQTMLRDVLHASGISNVPTIHVHSASPWEYRNRVRLRIHGSHVGYSRRSSNEFLAIEECPIASPLLIRMALRMREKSAWPDGASAMEMFTDAEERSVQISMHVDATVANVSRDAPQQLRDLCDALQKEFPQLVGTGLLASAPDSASSKRVQATQRVEIARWGKAQLHYRVANHNYTITRNAFFQVNRFLTSEMVQAVVDHRSGNLAFDLFAGAGLFSVPLAERFQSVTAVEIGEPAASDLKVHLALQGKQHRAICATTQSFLERETQLPDLVVMDPPRAGVSYPAIRSLAKLHPTEIVYVSCDADTFARDAKTLLQSGYALSSLDLFDLFPQTFHTETVAVFHAT